MCVYLIYVSVCLSDSLILSVYVYIYIYMYQDPQKTRTRGLSYRICRNPGELLICPQDSCTAPRIPALPQDSCTEQDFCDQSRNLVFCDVLAFVYIFGNPRLIESETQRFEAKTLCFMMVPRNKSRKTKRLSFQPSIFIYSGT